MIEYYVVFTSITHAMRVEKYAKLSGVRCTIVRTPSELKAGGCGYSLKAKNEESAWRILDESKKLGIKSQGLFSLTNGKEVVKML